MIPFRGLILHNTLTSMLLMGDAQTQHRGALCLTRKLRVWAIPKLWTLRYHGCTWRLTTKRQLLHKPHLPYMSSKESMAKLPAASDFPVGTNLNWPKDAPPVAWMACMGIQGETNVFSDFAKLNLTLHNEAPLPLVRTVNRGYVASVGFIDGLVGRLLDELDQLGLADDTVVALFGDHGQHLGNENMWCKMSLFEAALRVPLLIRAPGKAGMGQRTTTPVELLDVFPTLANLSGLPPPPNVEGKNLGALFVSQDLPPEQQFAFSQQARCFNVKTPNLRPTPSEQKLTNMETCSFIAKQEMNYMGYSVRTRSWRYNEWHEWNRTALRPVWGNNVGRELYDHRQSSDWNLETINLVNESQYADVVANLSAVLKQHFAPW
eukprot:m.160990 g.160990  ORF g.160990 m.160990 type:complete len:377 (+) comp24838_c0_seq4:1232-2362(+)